MIAWLNPIALAGLAALAVPTLIHLLRQHRASRLLFPSLRFVHPSRSAAVRLRRVSDPWLLLLRLAAVALAAFALAQPVLLTPGRVAAWNARVARAVVIDTSESMALHGATAAAREAADAEAGTAFAVHRIETPDLRAGLRQAAAWLATAPPAAREAVIVSDFQAGALHQADLAVLPAFSGVRAVPVGAAKAEHAFRGASLLSGAGQRRTDIRLAPSTTQVTTTADPQVSAGLRLLTLPAQEGGTRALMQTLASAGTPAPSASEPIAAVFPGGAPPAPLRPIAAGWMLAAVLHLMNDAELLTAAAPVEARDIAGDSDPWTVVSRNAQGQPVVRAAASGSELVIEIADSPGGYLAAAAVRGALLARQASSSYGEQEIRRVSSAELADWSRAPSPVGSEVAVHADQTDARWFWLLALLALGAEAIVRRTPPSAAVEEAHERAA